MVDCLKGIGQTQAKQMEWIICLERIVRDKKKEKKKKGCVCVIQHAEYIRRHAERDER
jgi:orotidine-5'-phosphate decarboxylase